MPEKESQLSNQDIDQFIQLYLMFSLIIIIIYLIHVNENLKNSTTFE